MKNEAMEERISRLSADYIYQQAVGSLLLTLMSAMEDAQKGTAGLPYEVPEDALRIKKKTQEYLLELKDLLDGSAEARMAAFEDCAALKVQLIGIYEAVYSYLSQWNVIFTLVRDQVSLRKYKEEHLTEKQIEWSLFFADCHAFIEEQETPENKAAAIGQLLKCIPLRVARERYYEEIQGILENAFAEESREAMEAAFHAFLSFCAPQENPDYGKYFPEIAQWIGQKRMVLPHNLSDDELAELYQELADFLDKMREMEEYFSCIFHDINSLLLLLYLTYSFGELTEGSAAYADLYHAVCEFLRDELTLTEKAAYLDTLMEQLEIAVEPVIDKANAIGREEYELLQKAGSFEGFSGETTKLLLTEDFIRSCYFAELEDAVFTPSLPDGLAPVEEGERKALIQAFLTKIRNSLDTLPVQTRKIFMQNLLGSLPAKYTAEETIERLMEAVDTCITEEQKALIVDKVGAVFEISGYHSITDVDEEEFGDMHGHHHHDCGCGHEHHDHEHHHH